jgi:epoxyqueuosine reductase
MTLNDITTAIAPHGLLIMGHSANRVLIGTNRDWWDHFSQTPEYNDSQHDPVDRWSKRILNDLAERAGARAYFPSDGPPYAPFIAWAKETGRFWQSPTGMLIHDTTGLMISIRGALEFSHPVGDIACTTNPCEGCSDRPCIAACPVGALSGTQPYDVPACKAFLDTENGQACMSGGCLVRQACPVSQAFGRPSAQSGFHMKAFRR